MPPLKRADFLKLLRDHYHGRVSQMADEASVSTIVLANFLAGARVSAEVFGRLTIVYNQHVLLPAAIALLLASETPAAETPATDQRWCERCREAWPTDHFAAYPSGARRKICRRCRSAQRRLQKEGSHAQGTSRAARPAAAFARTPAGKAYAAPQMRLC